jgi:hypothetical protein
MAGLAPGLRGLFGGSGFQPASVLTTVASIEPLYVYVDTDENNARAVEVYRERSFHKCARDSDFSLGPFSSQEVPVHE